MKSSHRRNESLDCLRRAAVGLSHLTVIAFVIAGLQDITVANAQSPNGYEVGMAKVVQEVKPTLPKKLNEAMSMIDISLNNHRLTQVYAIDTTKADLSAERLNRLRENLRSQTCQDSGMRETMTHGVAYEYSYLDTSSKPVLNLVVSAESCKD